MSPARLVYSALSREGLGRANNEDAVALCDEDRDPIASHGHLFALADGMGGYDHGEVASKMALDRLFAAFYGNRLRRPEEDIVSGMHEANERVYLAGQQRQARMGTTLTVLHILGRFAHIGHVGDSRAYLVRHHRTRCITNDHTPPGDLVRMHLLSPSKVRRHASRSLLNRSIGLNLFVRPDLTRLRIKRGDLFILCCDGVWAMVEDDEIGEIAGSDSDLNVICSHLIDLAVSRGGDDDLSVLAVRVLGLGSKKKRSGGLVRSIGRDWGQGVEIATSGNREGSEKEAR